MQTIKYILQKEFRQILRNKTLLPMMFWVPLMQLLVLVFAATFDIKNVKITVVDNDRSEISRQLVSKFEGSNFFTLIHSDQHPATAEKQLLEGKTNMVLLVPPGMEKTLIRENTARVQLLVDVFLLFTNYTSV